MCLHRNEEDAGECAEEDEVDIDRPYETERVGSGERRAGANKHAHDRCCGYLRCQRQSQRAQGSPDSAPEARLRSQREKTSEKRTQIKVREAPRGAQVKPGIFTDQEVSNWRYNHRRTGALRRTSSSRSRPARGGGERSRAVGKVSQSRDELSHSCVDTPNKPRERAVVETDKTRHHPQLPPPSKLPSCKHPVQVSLLPPDVLRPQNPRLAHPKRLVQRVVQSLSGASRRSLPATGRVI